MGLDQRAFARKEGEDDENIMDWRKHADLEAWMHDLYYHKGGKEEFNCQELSLTKEDLLSLKEEYTKLEGGCGFFWGKSNDFDKANTALFIIQALEYLEDGYEVIYTSWW